MLPFEFNLARKYLVPNKKHISVSLIAMMSVGVISLVVWLLLLFFSVTDGMEKNWLHKLTSLNAPLKVTPTGVYYNSYYYNIDAIASASNYAHKTIGEKLVAKMSDPYSPEEDRELPATLAAADRDGEGRLKDPVKEAYGVLKQLKMKRPDIAFQEFELSGALMRLELLRDGQSSMLTQATYLASLSDQSPYLGELILRGDGKTHFEEAPEVAPSWAHFVKGKLQLPRDGVLLAKNFADCGVKVGDVGSFAFGAQTASSVQEQRIGFRVAGFYDPGIMAVGNRCALVPHDVVRTISASSHFAPLDRSQANGIQVWFSKLNEAEKIRDELKRGFAAAGIDQYWKVATFREYDFAKDLLEQFQSDKVLFTLIGIIILIVGCSNIISLLVLLVNDKKKEIGILQAMGASPFSIAMIFGACGVCLGLISAIFGTLAALLTLHNIDAVTHFLSFVQGHEAFNALFYGSSLPSRLSGEAVRFILIVTPILSLVAGLIPAVKACRMAPSAILRAE